MLEKWLHSLAWGSSQIDWCEGNFQMTTCVAEFWNTVSNFLFFLFPPILIYLFQQYARQVTGGVIIVWLLLVVVGVGSVYFHATLSLLGQLLDEMAIIWVFSAAASIWYPRRFMPDTFKHNRQLFQKCILVFTVISSVLTCVMPAINCIVLFILAVPTTVLLLIELRQCNEMHVYNLGVRCCLIWIIAFSSWISDRLFCTTWKTIGFPYLHCSWHICVFLATYQACVLFAYFSARTDVPEQMPTLEYWPYNKWQFWGIPYVKLKCVGFKPTYKAF